ncbi:hypothetical protein ICL81_09295 [Leucobacter sp. cx-328]|uniref:hypothetical protein n=1 Tax=unclassified Leucobacter TaxID=2621730 RepID=UPI00165D67C2|nr:MULTISPECIES: hypothetical protein [unclassified Leucobacter]MBC9944701.1 hypothetical protein [Leucobacter sp. cx-328]
MSKGVQQENSAHSRITKWWIILACAIVMLVLLFLSDTLGRADRAAVEKGRQEITRAQYEAAFQNYQSCMIKIGHPIQGVTEEGMVYQFLIPKAAEDEGGEACYEQEFQDADVAWQTQDFVAEQSQAA